MWNPFAKKESKADERVLALATFVIGIGVMAVELTASRLLAPYFGASMFVWTSLIVTVLIALSIGYYLGGKAASKGVGTDAVGFLCCAAATLLVFGMFVIPSFSTAISGVLVGLSSASIALFLGSLAVTMLVFAAPLFLLGVSGPILLKTWSSLGDVGTISGRYFAVSTVGSIVGTVAPTLILVPTIGARNTIFAVAALFFAVGLGLAREWRRYFFVLAIAIGILPFTMPQRSPHDVLEEIESPYQLIRVSEQENGWKYLIFNEGSGIQSVKVPPGQRTGYYYDYMGIVPMLRPREDGRVHRGLIIGLAGGTVAERYASFVGSRHGIELTGVEVDPAVIDVARRQFDLDATGVKVVNEDGRTFFLHGEEQYDAIIADAYSTQLYIPPHLATREFFALAKTRLVDGGVFVMNVNAPSEESRLLKALMNTAASTYRHVVVMPIPESWNHLVFASDEPIDLASLADAVPPGFYDVSEAMRWAREVAYDPRGEVFTDDRAPVEFLTDSMILAQVVKRD